MIPKLTQARPNVLPNYWCGTCGGKLPPPEGPENTGQRRPWHFCPICGECIEYEMAEPVQWKELDCIRCGQPLIHRSALASMPPHYIAAPEYVGTSLCSSCMEEHCLQTNCLQCEVGQWPNCPYAYIKQRGMARSAGERCNGKTP